MNQEHQREHTFPKLDGQRDNDDDLGLKHECMRKGRPSGENQKVGQKVKSQAV